MWPVVHTEDHNEDEAQVYYLMGEDLIEIQACVTSFSAAGSPAVICPPFERAEKPR